MTTDILPEEWLPIPGYEGLYEVSNIGRVKRLERVVEQMNMYTMIEKTFPELIMSPRRDKDGYLTTMLRLNKKRKHMKLHRAVALAFLPNPNDYPQINHINSVKDDNRVENLEWCTNSHNHKHAYQNGHHALCLHRDPVTGRNKGVE